MGALTQTQRDLAQDFVELGLLFKRKAKSTRFYPTSIAINLIFGSSLDGDVGASEGRQQQQSGVTTLVRIRTFSLYDVMICRVDSIVILNESSAS